jgi:subtilisin family serine protease
MKHFQKMFSILLIVGMLLGWTTSGSILASSSQFPEAQLNASDKFEPMALEQLTAGKTDFFVTMAEQADLSYADQLKTKEEKGAYVFQTLVDTANRTQADLRAYLDRQGVEYTSFYIVNTILVKSGSLDLAMMIAGRKDVSQISANHTYQLDDPMIDSNAPNEPSGIEPNISFVKADQVWALGITGQGTVVAGNDTGLDETHPAIKARYRGCVDPPTCTTYDNNYNWWDATGTYPNDPWDGFGHGTHTTGTMMGDDGGVNQIGMAPGAQTIHCKNMTDGGSGDDNTFLTCFEWDLAPWDLSHSNPRSDLAPDAVNNSWGYWGGGQNQFRSAINNLQAAGVLVEVSAGNEGSSCSSLRSPGDYQEVLTTGSVNHAYTYPGLLTGFSSRGPSILDGNYFPDIMAPGENIRSSVPGGGYEGGWSGTSMAGPHATGLIALMWSAAPALRGQVAQTIQIIHDTAVPLTGQGGSNCGGDYTEGPNNDWGDGTIDALAAVEMAIALGGAGQLNGTVTDASSGDPIEGVNIHAVHDEGYSWDIDTDASGVYSMTVAAGTFTVTASTYGYLTQTAYPVEVVTDTLTTQDFEMVAAPTYTVSGHLYDAISGDPIQGTVQFTDAPVPPVDTDPNGFYSLTVADGSWTMLASADMHTSQTVQVEVHDNITQNFYLDPLPCILLVDDDNNSPNITPYYTQALDDMGYEYNIFDVGGAGGNGPDLAGLQGYRMVLWYSGDKFGSSAGPNAADEANLAAYLDGGGKLFLDSQDYLYDFDLTPFGSNYLGIQSYTNDNGDATSIIGLAGDPIGDGLGPYALSYPADFTDYGDVVNAAAGASVSFKANNNSNNLDVDKDGGDWQTAFFGTSWVAVYNYNAANGETVLQRAIDFFGGCEVPPDVSLSPLAQTQVGEPGMQVSYVYTVTNDATVEQEVTLAVEAVWPTEAPDTVGVLAAGASARVPVTVTIPLVPDVIIAEDTFTLTATGSVGGTAVATGTTQANVNPGVEVVAPEGQSGLPLEVLSFEFQVTNTGDYTDSFSLEVSGVWTATLPGGDNTGLLVPGASAIVTVLVQVPEEVGDGDTDVTTLMVTSDLDPMVAASADVTTTAQLMYYNLLPLISK